MSDNSFTQKMLDMLDAVTSINIPSRGRGNDIEDITLEVIIAQLGLTSSRLFLNDGLKTAEERFPDSVKQMREMAKDTVLGAEPYKILTDHPGTYLVKHPFGKNNWPEFVLHHNGRFLPIEIKSSASGQIVWNGGLPRQNCLYIYNYTAARGRNRADGASSGSDSRVTVCFGSDLMSRPVYDQLRANHEKVQAFARELHLATFGEGKPFPDDFGFSEYARAMFNHKKRMHACPETDMWSARSRQRLATWSGGPEELIHELRAETQLQQNFYKEKIAERDRVAAERKPKKSSKAKTTPSIKKSTYESIASQIAAEEIDPGVSDQAADTTSETKIENTKTSNAPANERSNKNTEKGNTETSGACEGDLDASCKTQTDEETQQGSEADADPSLLPGRRRSIR